MAPYLTWAAIILDIMPKISCFFTIDTKYLLMTSTQRHWEVKLATSFVNRIEKFHAFSFHKENDHT